MEIQIWDSRTSLVVQQLRLQASNAGGKGSIPGQETNIPHAPQCGQNNFFFSFFQKLKEDLGLISLQLDNEDCHGCNQRGQEC